MNEIISFVVTVKSYLSYLIYSKLIAFHFKLNEITSNQLSVDKHKKFL